MGLHIHDYDLIEPIRRWYKNLYIRIDESGLPHHLARIIMMFFDGIFNSVKLGIDVIPAEELFELQ